MKNMTWKEILFRPYTWPDVAHSIIFWSAIVAIFWIKTP